MVKKDKADKRFILSFELMIKMVQYITIILKKLQKLASHSLTTLKFLWMFT